MSNAKITIGITYIIVPILCIPLYLSFAIQSDTVQSPHWNATEYIVSGLCIKFHASAVQMNMCLCALITLSAKRIPDSAAGLLK
jgi:hypothetical protein